MVMPILSIAAKIDTFLSFSFHKEAKMTEFNFQDFEMSLR